MTKNWSDEEITALLDGALAPEKAAALRAAARQDPRLAARIRALELDTGQLAEAFEPMLGIARGRDLGARLAAARCMAGLEGARAGRRSSRWAWAASLAAAVALGAVLSRVLMPPHPERPQLADWQMEVAHYQALYVPETLAPIEPDPERLRREFARAGAALGLALTPEIVAGLPGLQLRRAQLLGFEGRPLVQIAFSAPDGTPVAFCILRRDGAPAAPREDELLGLAAASWGSATHGFLIIGGKDRQQMLDLARELRRRLEAVL